MHKKFDATILSYGLHINMTDKCVYCKEVNDQKIILYLYVDILIFGTNMNMINGVKSFLSQNFDMKDLG